MSKWKERVCENGFFYRLVKAQSKEERPSIKATPDFYDVPITRNHPEINLDTDRRRLSIYVLLQTGAILILI